MANYTAEDILLMKEQVKSLTKIITTAEKALLEKENRDYYIYLMKGMFEEFVVPKYPLKTFDESKIRGTGRYEEGSMRMDYTYDNVNMSYMGRRTCYKGDYDFFVDRSIYVDGKIILWEEKQ